MNLNKAERLTVMMDKLTNIQNKSRSSIHYEVDNAIVEVARQIKASLTEPEPTITTSYEPIDPF